MQLTDTKTEHRNTTTIPWGSQANPTVPSTTTTTAIIHRRRRIQKIHHTGLVNLREIGLISAFKKPIFTVPHNSYDSSPITNHHLQCDYCGTLTACIKDLNCHMMDMHMEEFNNQLVRHNSIIAPSNNCPSIMAQCGFCPSYVSQHDVAQYWLYSW